MRNNIFSLRGVLFFAGCFILLVFFIFIGLSPFISSQKPQSIPPKPTPGNFKTNYSNFNNLVPGKNNKNDVISLNGKPESEAVMGTKTYLYYSTPSLGIKNVAVLENNVLLYATEEVFAKYRGSPNDYAVTFGAPEITMYDKTDEVIEWRVYPSHGIAIAVAPFENVVVKITYFIPQTKNSFINSLSKELGLVQQQTAPTGIREETTGLN
jgi:hypothetical protein